MIVHLHQQLNRKLAITRNITLCLVAFKREQFPDAHLKTMLLTFSFFLQNNSFKYKKLLPEKEPEERNEEIFGQKISSRPFRLNKLSFSTNLQLLFTFLVHVIHVRDLITKGLSSRYHTLLLDHENTVYRITFACKIMNVMGNA